MRGSDTPLSHTRNKCSRETNAEVAESKRTHVKQMKNQCSKTSNNTIETAIFISLTSNPKWFHLSHALERSKAQKLIVVPILVKLSTVCSTLYLAVKQLACFL